MRKTKKRRKRKKTKEWATSLLLRSERPPTRKRRKERTELPRRKKSLRRKRKKRDLKRPPRHQVLPRPLQKPRRMLSLRRTTPLRSKAKKTKNELPLIPFPFSLFSRSSSAVDWGWILPTQGEKRKPCANCVPQSSLCAISLSWEKISFSWIDRRMKLFIL